MRRRFPLMLLLAGLTAGQNVAGFAGEWKLNVAKSTFSSAPFERGDLKWSLLGNGFRLIAEIVPKDGTRHTMRYDCTFNGKRQNMSVGGFDTKHNIHTVACKLSDEHMIEVEIDHDHGKSFTTSRYALSGDGRTLKETTISTTDEGRKSQYVLLWERR